MYLLFCLISRVEEIRALAGGSTFPEISKGKFREIGITEPPELLLNEFEELVSPIINQVRALVLQNRKLVRARDLLLPRLMSGEVKA
jgi:type I restriction enzyme S subunit